MNTDEKMDALGRMGEKVVVNLLSRLGLIIEESVDPFDSQKDMLVDGKKVEVKTQVPFILENAFTFKPNQLRKCRSVDVLYFVAVPAPTKKYKWEGWIFRVDPKNFKHRTRITKDGREMILIDIEQENVFPIEKVSAEIMEKMRQYTVSKY